MYIRIDEVISVWAAIGSVLAALGAFSLVAWGGAAYRFFTKHTVSLVVRARDRKVKQAGSGSRSLQTVAYGAGIVAIVAILLQVLGS